MFVNLLVLVVVVFVNLLVLVVCVVVFVNLLVLVVLVVCSCVCQPISASSCV